MTSDAHQPGQPPAGSSLRRWARWALAVFFVVAGANHFVNPDFYVRIMPPWLPWHRELVWLSGVFEVAGGVGVLVPRWRSAAGWGLVALLVAIFPANLHMAFRPDRFPDIPTWVLWARLPLQAVFIAWAWWATRPPPAPGRLPGGPRARMGAAVALLAVALGGAPPTAAQASGAPAEVAWRPERPVQGHLFVLRVTGAAGPGPTVASVRGTVGGEALHFEATGDGAFESLAPVPIGTDERMEATVTVTYADGREESVSAVVPVAAGEYRHERLTVAPRLGGPLNPEDQARLRRDQEKAAAVARAAHATPRLWTPDMVMPRDDRVTSGFGNGREFNGQVSSRHMGLDLRGDPGAPVVAVTRGVVELVDTFLLAGNIVYLNHGGGLLSGYFHLSEQLVAQGDTVEAGTPIGRVGATGRVTGPHLHWVVRYGTTSVDPRSLLTIR